MTVSAWPRNWRRFFHWVLAVTALAMGVTAGNYPMVEVLLALGANPNIRTGKGETALAIAQRTHKPELVDMLRQHGGQP